MAVLTAPEAVAYLNAKQATPGRRRALGPRRFRQMVADGTGPAVFDRTGRGDLFNTEALDAWAATRSAA